MESLAGIGVDVRTLPSDPEPVVPPSGEPSAVRLLHFQVRNMALELFTGAGTTGKDLDRATVSGEGAPVTPLLVGWLRSARTPAASLAQSAMAGQDLTKPEASVFPTLALVAFLADATRVGTTANAAPAAGIQLAALADSPSADLCSQVSAYLDEVLQHVANPQAQFDVPWLETVVDQYAPMYAGNTELFRKTVGALALLAYATSVARSWSVLANPAPSQVDYSIEGQDPVEGEVLVTVETGKEVFADEVQPCSSLAQIELEGSPTGASLYWDASGLGPHATATEADSELDVDQASFTYQTTAESAEAAQNGDPQTAEMSVLVIVDREEMRALAGAVAEILLGPAQNGPAAAAVKSLYLKMQPTLGAMMLPSAVATIEVTLHTPVSPSPSVEAADLSGKWVGTWENDLVFGDPPASGGFTLTLTQTGERVSGTARFSGPTCVREVPIEGAVRGSTVKLPMPSEWDIRFVGTVEGDSMSGTYSAIACGMTDFIVTGTWQAQRA
jgi:hypothetical protein